MPRLEEAQRLSPFDIAQYHGFPNKRLTLAHADGRVLNCGCENQGSYFDFQSAEMPTELLQKSNWYPLTPESWKVEDILGEFAKR